MDELTYRVAIPMCNEESVLKEFDEYPDINRK